MLINKFKMPIFANETKGRKKPQSGNQPKLKQLDRDVVEISSSKKKHNNIKAGNQNSNKRTRQKIQLLIKYKAHPLIAEDIGKLDDNNYVKVLRLMKKGMNAHEAYHCVTFNDTGYETAIMLLSKGASASQASALSNFNKEKLEQVLNLVNQGVSFHDSIRCNFDYQTKHLYNKFLKAGYSHSTASILANFPKIKQLNKKEKQALAIIAATIKANSSKTDKLSQELDNFYRKNPDCNLQDFAKYTQEVDFKKLKLDYPLFNKYSSEQFISFLYWHFSKNEKLFNEKTLTFDQNLTQYLSQNYISSDELNTLLTACPLTTREVGEIPSEWLDNVTDKEKATKKIYQAITIFQKNKKENTLAQNLSKITNQDIEVEKIGEGEYSNIYKITIKNKSEVCLKIFKSDKNTYTSQLHGRNAEVQAGLFLNQHTNRFVKMYFGRVCDKNRRDGFLVTQFLPSESPTIVKPETKAPDYEIKYLDAHDKNYIGNIIIDYGGTSIKKQT